MTASNLLRDHYDAKYAVDEQGAPTESFAVTRFPVHRIEACIEFFTRRFHGGDILELGAGSGSVAASLARAKVQFSSYTLTEFSPARLQGLSRRFSQAPFSVAQLDVDNFDPVKYPRFDAIVMIALIEHLVDPVTALRKIAQMLKPGGVLYVDTPNIAKYTRRLKLLVGRFPSTASRDEGLETFDGRATDLYDEGHLHYFTFRSLERLLLERCGFCRSERIGYHSGMQIFGRVAGTWLARRWPSMFSELAVAAYVE